MKMDTGHENKDYSYLDDRWERERKDRIKELEKENEELKQRLQAGQHETIVMRESDKAINWEVHDSEITGHVFEGNGVYIIKKFHQGDYKYMVSWRDDRKYEIIKLKESDHLLSLMKWCVEHWQLSNDVDA